MKCAQRTAFNVQSVTYVSHAKRDIINLMDLAKLATRVARSAKNNMNVFLAKEEIFYMIINALHVNNA